VRAQGRAQAPAQWRARGRLPAPAGPPASARTRAEPAQARARRPPPERDAAWAAPGAARADQGAAPPASARGFAAPSSPEREAEPSGLAEPPRPPPASRCPQRTTPQRAPHTPHQPRSPAGRSRRRTDAGAFGAGLETALNTLGLLAAPNGEPGIRSDEARHGDRDPDPGARSQAALEGAQAQRPPLHSQSLETLGTTATLTALADPRAHRRMHDQPSDLRPLPREASLDVHVRRKDSERRRGRDWASAYVDTTNRHGAGSLCIDHP
jgi:hypothetical protein